jgi:hypothetical protein
MNTSGAPVQDNAQSKTLWIGDIEPWMTEQDVSRMFENIA